MYRFGWNLLFLASFLLWAACPGNLHAQASMAKRGGPTIEIDGKKSQVFDYWKLLPKESDEKKGVYKFSLGKTKELEKMDDAVLLVEPVTGTEEELFSTYKKLFDDKAKSRVQDAPAPLKGKMLFINGPFLKDGKPVDGYRGYFYLVNNKDGKYLVQLTGPTQVTTLHTANLDTWMKGFK